MGLISCLYSSLNIKNKYISIQIKRKFHPYLLKSFQLMSVGAVPCFGRALSPDLRRLEGERIKASKLVKNPVKGVGALKLEEMAQKPGVCGWSDWVKNRFLIPGFLHSNPNEAEFAFNSGHYILLNMEGYCFPFPFPNLRHIVMA